MATVKPPTPKVPSKPAAKPAGTPSSTPKVSLKDRLRNIFTGKVNNIKQKIADKASQELSSGKLKDNTQILASRLINFFLKQESADSLTKNSPPQKILKGILKMMVEIESQRKMDSIKDLKTTKAEERELEKRQKEIIKALTIRFRPKKSVTKKKEKTEKEKAAPEAPKEGKPAAEVKKPETKAPEVKNIGRAHV